MINDCNIAYWADMFPDIKKDIEKLTDNYHKEQAKNKALHQKYDNQLKQKDEIIKDLKSKIEILQKQHRDYVTLKKREENRQTKVVLSDQDIWKLWTVYIDSTITGYKMPNYASTNINFPYIGAVDNTDKIKDFMQKINDNLHANKKFDDRFNNFDTIQQLLIKLSFTKM